MILRCDRCDRQLPDRVQSGPGTFTHLRDDLGTQDVLLCRYCTGHFKLFLAGARLEGEHLDLQRQP